jgi:hypothetical protein
VTGAWYSKAAWNNRKNGVVDGSCQAALAGWAGLPEERSSYGALLGSEQRDAGYAPKEGGDSRPLQFASGAHEPATNDDVTPRRQDLAVDDKAIRAEARDDRCREANGAQFRTPKKDSSDTLKRGPDAKFC